MILMLVLIVLFMCVFVMFSIWLLLGLIVLYILCFDELLVVVYLSVCWNLLCCGGCGWLGGCVGVVFLWVVVYYGVDG